jgi:hypothetical protein
MEMPVGLWTLYILGAACLLLALSLIVGARSRRKSPVVISSIALFVISGAASVGSAVWEQAHRNTPAESVGQGYPGESAAGKNDSSVGKTEQSRAGEIMRTRHPVELNDTQRQAIQKLAASAPREESEFPISIGAAVPRQARLNDIPPELSETLGGYNGDKFLVMRDQFVIVDSQVRRVVAIVPLGA